MDLFIILISIGLTKRFKQLNERLLRAMEENVIGLGIQRERLIRFSLKRVQSEFWMKSVRHFDFLKTLVVREAFRGKSTTCFNTNKKQMVCAIYSILLLLVFALSCNYFPRKASSVEKSKASKLWLAAPKIDDIIRTSQNVYLHEHKVIPSIFHPLQPNRPEAFFREIRLDFITLYDILGYADKEMSFIILLSCLNNLYFICYQLMNIFQWVVDAGYWWNILWEFSREKCDSCFVCSQKIEVPDQLWVLLDVLAVLNGTQCLSISSGIYYTRCFQSAR